MKELYSLAISARATLDLHSLNNEGGEGNQTQTRMVNIVGEDGRLYNVNAISGDMWKHIQAQHLFRLAVDRGAFPLCDACRRFDPNRISADPDFTKVAEDKGVSDAAALDHLLAACGADDLEGNLITTGNRSLPRKSVVEFGWVVGLPEITKTDSYFHVKYATERGQQKRDEDASEEARRANLGQAIFHRPASSGVYALVLNLELARIGFNDITQTYAIDEEQRTIRHQTLLESVLYTLMQPDGAMRNTQNPHLVAIEGVVSTSESAVPAPNLSSLNSDYRQQLEEVVERLAPLHKGSVSLHPFDSLSELVGVMGDLVQHTRPYTLHF